MSTNMLTLARQSLLEPAGLGETELLRLIGQLMSGSVDSGGGKADSPKVMDDTAVIALP